MTSAQKSALAWLRNRGGTGVFMMNGVLLAAGEAAPIRRTTWNALRAKGMVEIVGKRLSVAETGLFYDLRGVVESRSNQ